MNLQDKVVAVTGAGKGLGRAIAVRLAKQGACVAVVDIDDSHSATTVQQCLDVGGRAKSYRANVANESEVIQLFTDIVADYGTLHGVVNNAGIARDALLVKARNGKVEKKMTLQQWQSVIDVNLTGVFLCGREAAAAMIEAGVEEGVIVNISSVARSGSYGLSNYSATKAGVVTLAEVWAKELSRYNIRTGSVAPGIIDTELLAATQPEARERWISGIPLKRLGDVDHIAQSVQFIFENSYFTGRCIETDGGLR
ncbi:3-oxoacyl-ACP reductase [Gammaproteobacteria bacterium 45_16_T64]|nr:3-oxoacyl-ACP reductase [Gammaproteobacteria bacterium 45_16_T64]